MTREEYWKTRCELAEEYINHTPSAETNKAKDLWKAWRYFINRNKVKTFKTAPSVVFKSIQDDNIWYVVRGNQEEITVKLNPENKNIKESSQPLTLDERDKIITKNTKMYYESKINKR